MIACFDPNHLVGWVVVVAMGGNVALLGWMLFKRWWRAFRGYVSDIATVNGKIDAMRLENRADDRERARREFWT